jgi:hypothetical protein
MRQQIYNIENLENEIWVTVAEDNMHQNEVSSGLQIVVRMEG